MDALELNHWSKELQISPVEIMREEAEVIILDTLAQSPSAENLIFKDGTALRLVYGSPRFSVDLDFNQKGKIKIKELKNSLKKAAKRISGELKDFHNKRWTLFALLAINRPELKQAFSIKIEISKKKYFLKSGDYSLKAGRSPLTAFTPLLLTYSLERIYQEKQLAIKTRDEPRDYFDLWYVGQKLNRKPAFPHMKMHPGKFKGALSQLLPDYLKKWPQNYLAGKL